jgi:hypothetical protein
MLWQEVINHHDLELCEDTPGLNQIGILKSPIQQVVSISKQPNNLKKIYEEL